MVGIGFPVALHSREIWLPYATLFSLGTRRIRAGAEHTHKQHTDTQCRHINSHTHTATKQLHSTVFYAHTYILSIESETTLKYIPCTSMVTGFENAKPKLFLATQRYCPASSFCMLWIFNAPYSRMVTRSLTWER